MPARYTGGHRRSGNVDASSEARNVAKQLLGEIENAQRHGGPASLTRRRTLGDGTLVEATIAFGQASTRVVQPPRIDNRRLHLLLLQGLAVQPRTFAAADAFGDHPEALLRPANGSWRNFLFDDSYLEVGASAKGFYEKTKFGKDLFPDGLPSPAESGFIDWRNGDSSLVVCWLSSLSRYFPNGNNYESGDGKLYYNGAVLIDTATDLPDAIGDGRWVCGAGIHGDTLLLAIADQQDSGYLGDYFLRFYAAKLRPDYDAYPWFRELHAGGVEATLCPRLARVVVEDVTRVLEVNVPQLNSGSAPPRLFFNQAATECRGILHYYDFESGPDNDNLQVHELVVDWRAHFANDDPVTYTDTLRVAMRSAETVAVDYQQTQLNAMLTWDTMASTVVTFQRPWAIPPLTPIDGANQNFLPLEGERVHSEQYLDVDGDSAVDFYPLAVDYQDNEPVYLYAQPEALVSTLTFTGTATQSASASGMTAEAAMSATDDFAGSRGFGLKAVDKDSVAWLDLLCPTDRTITYEGASSESGVSGPSNPSGGAGSFSGTRSQADVGSTIKLAVHYLDLRYRSASYTLTTRSFDNTIDVTLTGIDDSTASSDSIFRVHAVTDEVVHTEYSALTKVLFYGTEVDSYTGTHSPADSTTGSDVTPATTYTMDYMRVLGWSGLRALPSAELESPYLFTNSTLYDSYVGTSFFPPTADYNDPITDLPDTSETGWQAPDGAYDAAYKPNNELLHDWPYNYNDPNGSVYVGAWGVFKDGWVYSMADLSGDLADPKWVTHLSGEPPTADALTGAHGLDSLGQVWPVSTFIHGYTFGL